MSSEQKINRLVILIVSGRQSGDLSQELAHNGIGFTLIDSSGGVLNEPTNCLFVGINEARLSTLLKIVRKTCRPQKEYIPAQLDMQPGMGAIPMIEAQVGGALVQVLNVSRFEQI